MSPLSEWSVFPGAGGSPGAGVAFRTPSPQPPHGSREAFPDPWDSLIHGLPACCESTAADSTAPGNPETGPRHPGLLIRQARGRTDIWRPSLITPCHRGVLWVSLLGLLSLRPDQ